MLKSPMPEQQSLKQRPSSQKKGELRAVEQNNATIAKNSGLPNERIKSYSPMNSLHPWRTWDHTLWAAVYICDLYAMKITSK